MIVPDRPASLRRLGPMLAVLLVAGSALVSPARSQGTASPADDTWIFAGILPASAENFSGTLTTDAADAEVELRLADGTTCDGGRLEDDVGVVTLHEAICSDGRHLRARFVSEGGTELRVFGTIGEEEFIVDAHLLDFDAPPDGAGRTRWPPALPPVSRRPDASP